MSPPSLALSVGILSALVGAAACNVDTPTDPTPRSLLLWSVTPGEQTITRGQTATFEITISRKSNINAQVALSSTAIPGATITFDPQVIPDTGTRSTMTVRTDANTLPVQLFDVTVIAVEGVDAPKSDRVRLTILPGDAAPSFSLALDRPDVTISFASPASVKAIIGVFNGFEGDIELSFTSPSPNITASGLASTLHAGPVSGNDRSFDVNYTGGTVSSPVIATVTARSGNLVRTQTLRITIGNVPTTPG